jgi:apolipoprotein N-acyltransferase
MPVRLQRGFVIRRFAPVALVPAGAFAVHQLRYWLAFGSHAAAELHEQGHSYLHSVVPWIVLLLAAATGSFLLALGRAFGGRTSLPRYTLSVATLWLLCSASLVAIYVCQEFLEGLFATGHPGGLAGIFGYGGWWAIPAAVAVGLVLTAAFHGARRVLQAVADRCGRSQPRASRRTHHARTYRAPLLHAPVPLVDGWSGRGPPA